MVCLDYRGKDSMSNILQRLVEQFEPQPDTAFNMFAQLPQKFLDKVKECSQFFMDLQVEAINRNVDLYQNKRISAKTSMRYVKELVWDNFIKKNEILPIDESRYITDGSTNWDSHIHMKFSSNKWLSHYTTFEEEKKLKYILEQFDDISSRIISSMSDISIRDNQYDSAVFDNLRLVRGQSFDFVNTTRFCVDRVMFLHRAWCEVTDKGQLFAKDVLHLQSADGSGGRAVIHCDIADRTLSSYVTSLLLKYSNFKKAAHVLISNQEKTSLPTSSCRVLDYLVESLNANKIMENDTVCIVNQPLLTRLQTGLFLIVSSCFESVQLVGSAFSGESPHLSLPVIVLQRCNAKVFNRRFTELNKAGYSPGAADVMEIIDTHNLISSPTHPLVTKYNAHLLLAWSSQIICDMKAILPHFNRIAV